MKHDQDASNCPVEKLSLQQLGFPLYPTPWRNHPHYGSQTPTVQISSTDRVQEMRNQIDKVRKRYSKSINKGRKFNFHEDDKILIDSRSMERALLNGSRLKFQDDLSIQYEEQQPKLLPRLITNNVQVGTIKISRDIALPKYLDKQKTRSVGHKKPPEYSIRRFSHVDDQVERVRLQQIDILKKYHVKTFSKDIQSKLKDELFIILKQFQ